MKTIIILAFALAMLALTIGVSATVLMDQRGELADAIEVFDGTPEELSDTLESSCMNVNTTAPVKYIRYRWYHPYIHTKIDGAWQKVITDNETMIFRCYYKRSDSPSFATFWSGKYNLTSREVSGMAPYPGTCFDSYHSTFPLIGDWCDQADIDKNGGVGASDFAKLRQKWMTFGCNATNDWCDRADIDRNTGVGMSDFARLRKNWQRGDCFGV
jgi:hypothetical protein